MEADALGYRTKWR